MEEGVGVGGVGGLKAWRLQLYHIMYGESWVDTETPDTFPPSTSAQRSIITLIHVSVWEALKTQHALAHKLACVELKLGHISER